MSWINWEKERKALKGVAFGAIAGALLLGVLAVIFLYVSRGL